MVAAVFRDSINTARFGVVLTYTLATASSGCAGWKLLGTYPSTTAITFLVPLFAYCEQEMASLPCFVKFD